MEAGGSMKRLTRLLLLLAVILGVVAGCSTITPQVKEPQNPPVINTSIKKDGEYTSKEEVALYIHTYGELPSNFITKQEAMDLGWVASKGNLNEVAPGKSIGGDRFSNREKLLPTDKSIKYFECDIDYRSGPRNGLRIVYSNRKEVYFSDDHYESFERLY